MANDTKNQTKDLADYLQKHNVHIEIDDPWPTDKWFQQGKIRGKKKKSGDHWKIKNEREQSVMPLHYV